MAEKSLKRPEASQHQNNIRPIRQGAVERFRQRYHDRYQNSDARGLFHFAFILCFCFFMMVWPWFWLEAVHLWELAFVPVTFVIANLVEYLAHRGPMHRPWPGLRVVFEKHSLEHHQFFTDEQMECGGWKDVTAILFPKVMLLFFFGGIALPIGFLIYKLAGWNSSMIFAFTASAYYFAYEVLHFLYHTQNPWFSHLSRHHGYHHSLRLMGRYNFNVTFPLGDWLFGTYYSQKK